MFLPQLLPCYCYRLRIYTMCVHQLRFIIIALCSVLVNQIGKKEVKNNKYIYAVFYFYLCSYLYQCSLFLSVDLSYCSVFLHFNLMHSLWYLL